MLARAPDDVTLATLPMRYVAHVKTFPRRGTFTLFNLGQPGTCSRVRRERTRGCMSQRRTARDSGGAPLAETALRAIRGPGTGQVTPCPGRRQCAASYSAMIVAGMRPRSLTLWPRCRAQALISALRSRPGPVRARRRRPAVPARLAWSVYGLNLS